MLSLQTVRYLLYPDFNAILFSVIRTASMTSSGAGVDPSMTEHEKFIGLIFGYHQYKTYWYTGYTHLNMKAYPEHALRLG